MRGELFADGGYGGRRLGGVVHGRWPATRALDLTAGLAAVNVAGASPRSDGTSVTLLGHAAWQLDDGIAVLVTGEVGLGDRAAGGAHAGGALFPPFEPDM